LWGRYNCAPRALLLEAIVGIVLHTLELHLKLLVAVLKLFNGARELAQRIFHSVKPNGKIAGIGLRHLPGDRRLSSLTRLRLRITAPKQVIKEIAGRVPLLRQRGAGHQQRRQRGKRSDTKRWP
jgi:hypothetical protein